MTNFSRPHVIGVLGVGTLVLTLAATSGTRRPPIAEKVAKTFGVDSFGKIEGIRYTFNLDFPLGKFSRSWEWDPKTNTVSFDGKDKEGKPLKVTYQRSQLASQSDVVKKEVEPAFTNDQYWLLFPFHMVWDSAAAVTDDGMQALPSGEGSAEKVVVKYQSDVGFTPGDTWSLFVGKDNRVEQLLFQHGGSAKPSVVIATWEGYKKAGPLLFSTDHRGTADGKPLHLTFTDVAVKMAGSSNWINAQ